VVGGIAVIGGLFALFKWLFRKKGDSSIAQTKIQQRGTDHTATVAGRDVHIGIESDNVLDRHEITLKQLGQSEEIIKNQRETIRQLEEQLSQSQIMADTGRQQVPQPSQEAKDLAAQSEDDAAPYALALKAIATGNTEQADELLDQTQQFLDTVQQKKDQAQAKIYMARMQNASYAGRPHDALQYCDKLTTLAGNDPLIINNMAAVYYENAKYKQAEPLMERVAEIFEKSLGENHPNVAAALNNLAMLYQATNRLKEAEPLMQRALAIDEASLGKDHPAVATHLNNLARLYQDTNRLKEAQPLMQRALKIAEASLGRDHPKVAIHLNNLAQLYKDTNRLKEAEPLIQRALKIDEASLGKEHPRVGKTGDRPRF
jgi:tetratricopeptide (TPR) repeat protein